MQLFFKRGKRGDLLAYTTVQGQAVIALYDRAEMAPAAGTVEVIITGLSCDSRRLFVARKDGLTAVAHTGFSCSGGMCQTLAFSPAYRKSVSPGRAPVYVADQLGQVREVTRPGTVYCRSVDFRPGQPIRAYGVDIDEAEFAIPKKPPA
jgi:hypothetical protein